MSPEEERFSEHPVQGRRLIQVICRAGRRAATTSRRGCWARPCVIQAEIAVKELASSTKVGACFVALLNIAHTVNVVCYCAISAMNE